MIIKRELGCQGKNQKCKNIKVDNFKQMRSSWQNDKLEQLVMHRDIKDKVLGTSLGSNEHKVFSTFNCLCYRDLAFKTVQN